MLISSKANPTVKHVSSLAEKKFRKEFGEFLVEGIKAVDECISSGAEIVKIICTENLADKYTEALTVTEQLFGYISTEKTPQGVIAVVKTPQNELISPDGGCLLLDRIQDPGNIGTIIRTANAAGYKDIYLVNCVDPFSPKAVRASMGGIFYVNLHFGSYEEVFGVLKGVKIITADMDGEDVFKFVSPSSYCLCIGNEGNGVSEEVTSRSDYTVKVPMRETCESLNAAVSAGIIMYALKNLR